MPSTSHHHHHRFDLLLALVLLAGMFVPVFVVNNQLLAATYSHNPYGAADSCAFVNGQTVLYGWAYDPDTGSGANPYVAVYAGSASAKVASNISNYRDTYVNNYVKNHNPGAPTNGEYGWKWTVSGLTQGTSYTVKGTVLDYGSGNNVSLMVATSAYSGMSSSRHPFTSTHTIPNTCLAPQPAPAPAPAPTPAPVPTTSTTNTTRTTTSHTTPSSSTATPAAPPTPTASEITTKVGTASAVISLPVSGATAVTVTYAPDPQSLSQTAGAPDVTGQTASVTLKDLQPHTTYNYTVSRVANGKTSTSSVASFTTHGYAIKAQFLRGNDTPVAGIKGSIGKATATSDKQGYMTFNNLGTGDQTLTFSYGGKTYHQTISTSDAAGGDGQTLTTQQIIDLTHYADTAHKSGGPSPALPLIVVSIVFLLAAGAVTAWFLLRRQSRPLPRPTTPFGDPLTARSPAAPKTPSEPLPTHAGQSLATMVMEAMQQERQQAQAQPPQPENTASSPEEASDRPGPTPPATPPPMMPPSPQQ